MSRLLAQVRQFIPYVIAGVGIYLAMLGWLWWSMWTGAEAITARLAVGDSARNIITLIQASLSVIGLSGLIWFIVAPKRYWKNGVIALTPYVFTWILVKTIGANASFVDPKQSFRFCTFDSDTLVIGGEYDLSEQLRKSPPPYFDPKTGIPLVPCAEAERLKVQLQRKKDSDAKERQAFAESEQKKNREIEFAKQIEEQKRRALLNLRAEIQNGTTQLSQIFASRGSEQVVVRLFENGQAISFRILSSFLNRSTGKLEIQLHIEWKGWFRVNRSYSTDGTLKVALNGDNATWQSKYLDGALLAYMNGAHPAMDLFAEYGIGDLGQVDSENKSVFVLRPNQEKRISFPDSLNFTWVGQFCDDAEAQSGFKSWRDGEQLVYKNTSQTCTYTAALMLPD